MIKKTSLLILIAVIFASCSRVPITNRKQFRMLPENLINSMALTAYNDFMATSHVIPTSDSRSAEVSTVGERLQNATVNYISRHGYKDQLSQFSWQFSLVDNQQVNAFCMPGGKIVVFSGILPITKNETGLATVLSHEIAHAVARHGNERMSQQLSAQLGGIALNIALQNHNTETRNIFNSVYGIGGQLGLLAYSRQHEYEADKIGMVLMTLAGYNPEEAINFWSNMAAMNNGSTKVPEFLSTHPSDQNRIAAMEKFLPKAKTYTKSN